MITFILGGNKSGKSDHAMRDLEIPLIPVLAAMERRGVRIDFAAFRSFLDEVSAEVEAHTRRIQELAGGPVNVRSSKQLSELLFKKLGLKPAGKTPGGALSTGSEALEKLAGQHPVIEEILAFRVQEKLRSTYLDPMSSRRSFRPVARSVSAMTFSVYSLIQNSSRPRT